MLYFGRTIKQCVRDADGHPSGFDYLRIALAIGITLFHSLGITYGEDAQINLAAGPFNLLVWSLVPMFFALSGFLVAGSLDRNTSIVTFLGLRALRIFPALTVDTLFCALILGPIFTTLAWSDYFASPVLHNYFLNIAGRIHYYLPGVFETNPLPNRVNGQLWTIPSELKCYIILTLTALFGIYGRRWLFLSGLLALQVISSVHAAPGEHGGFDTTKDHLVLCFLAGVAIHLFQDRIVHNSAVFAAAIGLIVAMNLIPTTQYYSSLPLAYVTVFVGTLNPRKLWPLQTGDYSYGIYLYGSPIQQAVVAALPFTQGRWLLQYPISLVLIIAFAVMSWHFVEKHALAQRGRLYAMEKQHRKRWSIYDRLFGVTNSASVRDIVS